jgi:hypothetical protein
LFPDCHFTDPAGKYCCATGQRLKTKGFEYSDLVVIEEWDMLKDRNTPNFEISFDNLLWSKRALTLPSLMASTTSCDLICMSLSSVRVHFDQ